MTLEETRKFHDEWMASRPKWPQRKEHPLIQRANEAYASLSENRKTQLMKKSLELTPTQRFEQHQERLELILDQGESCRSNEDFIRLLYNDS